MKKHKLHIINLFIKLTIGFAGILFVSLCGNLTFYNFSYAAYELEQEIDYTTQLVPEREHFAENLLKTLKFRDDDKFFEHATRTRDFILGYQVDLSIERNQIQQFLFRNFTSPKQVKLLQKLFPNILESEQEWQTVSQLIDKLYQKFPSKSEQDFQDSHFKQATSQFFSSLQFYLSLEKALEGIDSIVKDGDTLIAVGNTPQFIRIVMEFSRNNIHTIPIAISSWPGKEKDVYDGVHPKLANHVTPDGLKNYRNYLAKMGISPARLSSGKIYLLDYVSSGGGIEFLIQQIHQMYKAAGNPQPEISLISIGNDLHRRRNLRTVTVDTYPLNLPELASALDTAGESSDNVTNPLRVLPNFPAWKWHNWEDDPIRYQPGTEATDVIRGIRRHFISKDRESRTLKIRNQVDPYRAIRLYRETEGPEYSADEWE